MRGRQMKVAERENRRKGAEPIGLPWGCRKYRYHCHLKKDGALSDFEKIRRHFMSAFHFRKTFPRIIIFNTNA